MVKRVLILFIIVAALVNGSAPAGSIILRGKIDKPLILDLDSLNVSSKEVLVLRPYRADLEKTRAELEMYRKLYLLFAILQGYVLIDTVSRM